MSDDFRVKSRSNAEVRALAEKAREFFGVAGAVHVDILECLRRKEIWTVQGVLPLTFRVLPDRFMGADEGVTRFEDGGVVIEVRESVERKAFYGNGRSRNTLTHELGHGVLGHDKAPAHRRALGNVTPKWIEAFESAEHQTRIFTPAFLVDYQMAARLSSAAEISSEFGISLESAEIIFNEILSERHRQTNAEVMLRKAAEFRCTVQETKNEIKYLDEICTRCKQKKLFPVGIKYMCHSCEAVYDRFQDGDSIDWS